MRAHVCRQLSNALVKALGVHWLVLRDRRRHSKLVKFSNLADLRDLNAKKTITQLNALADTRQAELYEQVEFGPETGHVRHANRPHLINNPDPRARFNSLDLLNRSFQSHLSESDLKSGSFIVNAVFKDYETRISIDLPVRVTIESGSTYNSFNFHDMFESFCDATEELDQADLTHDSRVYARRQVLKFPIYSNGFYI